jgi:hypothetical protein
VGEGGRGRAADREGDSRINFGGKKREWEKRSWKQGCQIFLGATYQNVEKYTESS